MRVQRATPVNEFLAKLIFLILPTIVVGYYLLDNINIRYEILQNQALMQSVFLAAGMVAAAVFYAFRFRFLPTFSILLFVLYSTYKGLDNYATGEFDTFILTMKFMAFAILFSIGWLTGWGYVRIRYFAVFFSAAVLTACIALVASAKVETVQGLLVAFLPAVLYLIYNVFTAEQIYNYKDKSGRFWWYMVRRLLIFSLLVGFVVTSVVLFMYGNIKDTVASYGGGGKKGQNSMTKQNKDGTFDLNDYSRLSSSLNRDKELLFCAHINNYFPGTNYPNPLYLTAFYFTKFDTATETFERDKIIPYNDLFEPDPSKIPLFGTKIDTNVIKNSLGDMARSIVDVEIYNCKLSPSTYLAPNVGFFVQPITIEKDFRERFRSAYRTKSYVSALNSAYFVYNMDTPVIRKFQEERFRVLRDVQDYKGVDPKFFRYYTYMPSDQKFRVISDLAHKVTDSAKTPVDKVIAIRDYFLSKNENGERLYKYTDNPGEPDIPSASKLIYFLTENHKGYCAYYAGATLFMLRSLGIPSRIAVGFLTEDRSDKNKGWYWYYANQAHAWIQVYFPGYGWLDFDTTVGNTDENRPTPQPDGTPPMQPPKAWLAAEAMVERVDTLKKQMQVAVHHFVFHDKEYDLGKDVSLSVDMKVAVVYKDSATVPLTLVHQGDKGTLVSYAEAMKTLEPADNEGAASLIKRFPQLLPVDEFYLKSKDSARHKEDIANKSETHATDYRKIILLAVVVLSALLLLLFLLPEMVLWYYLSRYKNSSADKNKAYWAYRAAGYYLHMVNYPMSELTPMQYALKVVQPVFGSEFYTFMIVYLKNKYAGQPLNDKEKQTVATFLFPFIAHIKRTVGAKQRLSGFLNIVRMAAFFTRRNEEN
jgi:hypothetical protein